MSSTDQTKYFQRGFVVEAKRVDGVCCDEPTSFPEQEGQAHQWGFSQRKQSFHNGSLAGWGRGPIALTKVSEWDPTICEHCKGPMSEPHLIRSQGELGTRQQWINHCLNCGSTRGVPPNSPILNQYKQDFAFTPYPDLLREVGFERPWMSGKVVKLIGAEKFTHAYKDYGKDYLSWPKQGKMVEVTSDYNGTQYGRDEIPFQKTAGNHSLWFKPGRDWGKGLFHIPTGRLITWPEADHIQHAQMAANLGWDRSTGRDVRTLDITPDGIVRPRGRLDPGSSAMIEAIDPRLAVGSSPSFSSLLSQSYPELSNRDFFKAEPPDFEDWPYEKQEDWWSQHRPTEPEFMYHVSPVRNRQQIRSEGLDPSVEQMNPSGHEPGAYLWDDPEVAWKYRGQGPNMHKDMDMHAVDTTGLKLLPDRWLHTNRPERAEDFPGAWYSVDPIPADRVTEHAYNPWFSEQPRIMVDPLTKREITVPAKPHPDWHQGKIVQTDYYHVAPTTERARIQQHGVQPSRPSLNDRWSPLDLERQPSGVYVMNDPQRARELWGYSQGFEPDAGSQAWDTWRIPTEQVQRLEPDPEAGAFDDEMGLIPHVVHPELYEGGPEVYGPWPKRGRLAEAIPFDTSKDHQLWFNPGPRAERLQQWGRGLYHEPSGIVHTWPETEGTHVQMMEAKGLNPLESVKFSVWPNGTPQRTLSLP